MAATTSEEQHGDVPLPRFGHTTTLVGGTRVILFGGATGDSGRYLITSDTYSLEVSTGTWTKVVTDGDNVPTARAAHAAACVDSLQLVVYGGATGGGSLSSDEIFLLDIRDDVHSTWMSVPVLGPTPGRRYGHSMVFNKPLLVVFGGNNGQQAMNDIWVLDVDHTPFQWQEVALMNAKAPLPRVYHSADVCREGPAAGMMVVFGGRTAENRSLKDTWGVRQHRDGRWDWVEAPVKRGAHPEARFQHCSLFHGTRLLIVGGRAVDVNKPLPTSVYDTESCEWSSLPSMNRFRHAVWDINNFLFCYGGFDHKSPSAPTSDLQLLDLDRRHDAEGLAGILEPQASTTKEEEVSPEAPAPPAAGGKDGTAQHRGSLDQFLAPTPAQANFTPTSGAIASEQRQQQPRRGATADKGDIKISNQVYVSLEKDFTHLVRKVAIETLEDEGKKMGDRLTRVHWDGSASSATSGMIQDFVIEQLCQPTSWQPDPDPARFLLQSGDVCSLCDQVLEVMKKEPMVLRLRAPIKVYGDIHGQYLDLMRLFARYKSPTEQEGGDIDSMDYLFLGDFVDRGAFSLETCCLLFALKLRYPAQIHLIRGNHEDPQINAIYGFWDECRRRLHEDPEQPDSCWNRFNRVFEWLPCGAIIEDRILCVHGGIGGSLKNVSDIEGMQRPLQVAQIPQTALEQQVTDLLWSDPSDNDMIKGVTMNETRDPEGTGRIVKFGPDRVEEFLEGNPPLSMIVRAHECVMDGFERFANGRLITLFSATDYCGHHKNAGALLFIRRDLTVVPKLIYPVERSLNTTQQQLWDPRITQQRPATPPRAVPRADRGLGLGGDHMETFGGGW